MTILYQILPGSCSPRGLTNFFFPLSQNTTKWGLLRMPPLDCPLPIAEEGTPKCYNTIQNSYTNTKQLSINNNKIKYQILEYQITHPQSWKIHMSRGQGSQKECLIIRWDLTCVPGWTGDLWSPPGKSRCWHEDPEIPGSRGNQSDCPIWGANSDAELSQIETNSFEY